MIIKNTSTPAARHIHGVGRSNRSNESRVICPPVNASLCELNARKKRVGARPLWREGRSSVGGGGSSVLLSLVDVILLSSFLLLLLSPCFFVSFCFVLILSFVLLLWW